MQWTQQEDELCYDEEGLDAIQKQNAAYNLGDLKREEDVLMTLYSKMSDQLHKLEVEELELKQKIRRKELNETTAELFPPPPPVPSQSADENRQRKKGKGNKGKAPRRRRRRTTTSSMSHDDLTSASELDDAMSVASSSALSTNLSPARSVKMTPTRRSPRSATKAGPAAKALMLPDDDDEPEKLDLSALNSLSLPIDLNQSAAGFIESEDED